MGRDGRVIGKEEKMFRGREEERKRGREEERRWESISKEE